MKQVFLDKGKMVAIKIFKSKQGLEQEVYGAKALSQFVQVPKIEKLDCKVAKIEFLNGFLGYQIPEEDLEILVASYIQSLKPIKVNPKYSITQNPTIFEKCAREVKNLELFPLHGDLQKQNIVVTQGQLGLIDFEHFIFAPRELELANSLFFNDGNCLNVQNVVNLLPEGLINRKTLKLMLEFYALKQIDQGMSQKEAQVRLKLAVKRLENLKKIGYQTVNSLGSPSSLCYL